MKIGYQSQRERASVSFTRLILESSQTVEEPQILGTLRCRGARAANVRGLALRPRPPRYTRSAVDEDGIQFRSQVLASFSRSPEKNSIFGETNPNQKNRNMLVINIL